jgi:cell division protein FtsB
MARGRRGLGRWAARAAWGVLGIGALVFAVEGGEYGTSDLRRQRVQADSLAERLRTARAQVDSLAREREAIRRDPVVIERLAREQFGLVRGEREVVYWTPREPGSRRAIPP